MKIIDIIVPTIVFIIALAYLYRVFFVKKGCSCGNTSCSAPKKTKIVEQKDIQDLREDREIL